MEEDEGVNERIRRPVFQQQRRRRPRQEVTATSIPSDFISIPLEPAVHASSSLLPPLAPLFTGTPFLVDGTTYPAVVRDAKVGFIMIIRRTEVRLTTLTRESVGFPPSILPFSSPPPLPSGQPTPRPKSFTIFCSHRFEDASHCFGIGADLPSLSPAEG